MRQNLTKAMENSTLLQFKFNLNFGLGSWSIVFIFWLGNPTTVLNFGFGSRTSVLNFGLGRWTTVFIIGLGSPTTVLNFGFGSRTTAPNFRLGSRTTLRQDSDLSIKGYSLLQEVCINLQIQLYVSVL